MPCHILPSSQAQGAAPRLDTHRSSTATCPMAKFIHTTNKKPSFTRAPDFPGYVPLSALEITFAHTKVDTHVLTHREMNASPDHWPLLNCTSNPLQDVFVAGLLLSLALTEKSNMRWLLPAPPVPPATASGSLQVLGIFMAAVITPTHLPAARSLPPLC